MDRLEKIKKKLHWDILDKEWLISEIEQLGNTLDIVRENIYDCGWINLESFDEIVQALKEE